MDYAGLKKNNNNITLTMSKEKAQIGVKIAKKKKSRKKTVLAILHCERAARLCFFYPAGLDADRGSALGPRGNRSLHTPSTFFQQEKYCPLKQKYTVTKKQN